MVILTETEKAYIAGIIDGEGHIGIVHTKDGKGYPYYRLMMDVTQCDIRLILWLHERLAGVMHKPRYATGNGGVRMANRITWADRKASDLLEAVMPYMVLKKEQAEIAVAFQNTKGKGGFGVKPDNDARAVMKQQISDLNKGVVDA